MSNTTAPPINVVCNGYIASKKGDMFTVHFCLVPYQKAEWIEERRASDFPDFYKVHQRFVFERLLSYGRIVYRGISCGTDTDGGNSTQHARAREMAKRARQWLCG